MGIYHDISGKTYGEWTVINRHGKTKSKNSTWVCRCKCGKEKICESFSIRNGLNGKNCGCTKDWTGKKYGSLTVIRKIGLKSNHNSFILCRCDCGAEKEIWGSCLFSGTTRSCGCYRKRESCEKALTIVIGSYRKHAIDNERDFLLSRGQFKEMISTNCYYCGCEPNNCVSKHQRKGESISFYYNGIDRIDSKKGYFIENCVPCCKICNIMKRDLDVDEWLSKIRQILANFDAKKSSECIMESANNPQTTQQAV